MTPRSIQIGGENLYYKSTDREKADPARRQQDHGITKPAASSQLLLASGNHTEVAPAVAEDSAEAKWAVPPMPFASGADLLRICHEHNMTIAQVCWQNEKHYLTDEEIKQKTLKLWGVMDQCIREGKAVVVLRKVTRS